ncbi:MAG: hypothetical protein GX120_01430 [Methanosarcina mazei]|jgi:hypothetical protein|nr:hypothetical protein [Methanosarcina mazei]
MVLFKGHSAYFGVEAQWLKLICGKENLVIVDGRNVVEPEEFIKLDFGTESKKVGENQNSIEKNEKI